jgi:hypothetical protein
MNSSIKKRLKAAIRKDLVVDLDDRLRAEALKAFEMVRDRAGLDPKRSRELEGQARFRMMEQAFQQVCELHGGELLDGGVIPATELKVFQPFMRFEINKHGVIMGLAAMPDRKVIPTKNKSRVAGVSLNYHLSPRLDLDGSGPKIGDIFALFLVCRDHAKSGKIEEIAIGVVNSKYESFLFYEPLAEFLSGHADIPKRTPKAEKGAPAFRPSTVSLKKNVTPFIPPELPKTGDDEQGTDAK